MSTAAADSVGWREWVGLPDLGVEHLKAKVDTGARTSALHAEELERFVRGGRPWVRFVVHPHQRSEADAVLAEAALLDEREVRSSSGAAERRPVVRTRLRIAGHELEVELTLTSRTQMGFRMLVGREAVRGSLLVDPGRSYVGGRPPLEVRRANAGRGASPGTTSSAHSGVHDVELDTDDLDDADDLEGDEA